MSYDARTLYARAIASLLKKVGDGSGAEWELTNNQINDETNFDNFFVMHSGNGHTKPSWTDVESAVAAIQTYDDNYYDIYGQLPNIWVLDEIIGDPK